MVKNINLSLDDIEYDELARRKPDDKSWRAWFLSLAGVEKKGDKDE